MNNFVSDNNNNRDINAVIFTKILSRQESDYTAFTDFKQEYVKEQIDLCQKFLAEIESLLEFDN